MHQFWSLKLEKNMNFLWSKQLQSKLNHLKFNLNHKTRVCFHQFWYMNKFEIVFNYYIHSKRCKRLCNWGSIYHDCWWSFKNSNWCRFFFQKFQKLYIPEYEKKTFYKQFRHKFIQVWIKPKLQYALRKDKQAGTAKYGAIPKARKVQTYTYAHEVFQERLTKTPKVWL